jgi:NAD(P)-dependent dehydrogenase (short-subunit alcohol dehydrogenase family)
MRAARASIANPTLNAPSGANSVLGIGRATCHQFAENGAKAIYMCDFDQTNLDIHKREIQSQYPSVDIHVRQFDAANEEAIQDVVNHALTTYGRLDIFFANAGITGNNTHFKDVGKSDFMKVMETNAARSDHRQGECFNPRIAAC